MPINPELLILKSLSELEEVQNPTSGKLTYYDGDGDLKLVDISEFFAQLQNVAQPISTTDPTPAIEGWYKPEGSGVYANAGNLEALSGFDTLFYFDGTNWTKTEVEMPQASQNIVHYDDISSAPITEGTQFIHDTLGFVEVMDGQTLAVGENPEDFEGIKVEKINDGLRIQNEVGKFLHGQKVLIKEGDYFTEQQDESNYPNGGIISSTTGVYSTASNRKATDFIDLTGFQYILQQGQIINSATGTAFYDENQVYISGFANNSEEQIVKIPINAKFVRTCSQIAGVEAKLILIKAITNKANSITFINGNEKQEYEITPKALPFAINDGKTLTVRGVAKDYGEYLIKEEEQILSLSDFPRTFANGTIGTSSLFQHSELLEVGSFNQLKIKGLTSISTNNNICFFDENQTYCGFWLGKTTTNEEYGLYPIPKGVRYYSISISDTVVSHLKVIAQEVFTLENGEVALIEDSEVTMIKEPSDAKSTEPTATELMADLPHSDGTTQQVGDVYYDTINEKFTIKS